MAKLMCQSCGGLYPAEDIRQHRTECRKSADVADKTGLTSEQWRELIKPLFLKMHEHGVMSVNVDRQDTIANVRVWMQDDEEGKPIDVLLES